MGDSIKKIIKTLLLAAERIVAFKNRVIKHCYYFIQLSIMEVFVAYYQSLSHLSMKWIFILFCHWLVVTIFWSDSYATLLWEISILVDADFFDA